MATSSAIIVDIVRATTGGSLTPFPQKEPKKVKNVKEEEPQDSALWLAENELMKVSQQLLLLYKRKITIKSSQLRISMQEQGKIWLKDR
jgi:hypothetical protein